MTIIVYFIKKIRNPLFILMNIYILYIIDKHTMRVVVE